MDEKRVTITINFVIDFKICTGFFLLFFLVKLDLLIMSDVYTFQLKSETDFKLNQYIHMHTKNHQIFKF
jgi:hypothetical protein